jgi:ATP-dependent helicase HrpA
MTDAPARRSRRPNRRRTTNKATTNKGSANQGPVHQYPELQPARDRLTGVGLFDADRLGRTADRLARSSPLDASAVSRLDHDLTQAESRLAARRAGVPKINYPPQLPVSQRHDDLAAAIQANQVVIVAGETGSGKTTQLPKLCLELGRGVRGLIGHTQPRRIAARAVAERVAEELDVALGEQVGYAIRFTDKVSDKTLVKLMTDGILLAEIGRDRMLRRYDTIIIDEAHERSLNIDFLLGYLQQLLPRRPDLKLIITSATIDPQRFATYFGDAPIVEVSGRGYPVEVRYRPVSDPDRPDVEDRDQVSAICYAVAELRREPAGDVLVFLSGEREIRDAADAVAGMQLPDTEVLPLYGRLSSAEQHRVFAAHRQRRIVLATNVAETSLTVPGIRYVIDTGTARISRYSSRTKVQLLPIEPVSQASATQRAGRCGRTAPGVCIRLYSEADFESRPVFTDPEILRTNLASVILQMAALDLGKVENFGFLDPPDRRQIADGLGLLAELGALVVEESASSTSAAGPPESTARVDRPSRRPSRRPRRSAGYPRSTAHTDGPPAGPAAGRSAAGPDDHRGREPRLPHRRAGTGRGVVHPGPAGAAGRTSAGGRCPARPVHGPDVGLLRLPRAVAVPARATVGAFRESVSGHLPAGVPELPANPRMAGPVHAAPANREEHGRHHRQPAG